METTILQIREMEAAALLGQINPPETQHAVLGLVWGCGEGCPGSGILLFIPDLSCITSNTEGTCRAGEGVLQLGEEARDSSQCVIALIRREGSGQSRQQRATETLWRGQVSFLLEGESRCLQTMPLTPVINRGNPLPQIPLK